MKSTLLKMSFLIVVSVSVGCQALKMDYGQPAAQFLEKDVATAGKKYLGKKNHHTCRELTTNRWSSVARGVVSASSTTTTRSSGSCSPEIELALT